MSAGFAQGGGSASAPTAAPVRSNGRLRRPWGPECGRCSTKMWRRNDGGLYSGWSTATSWLY